MCWERDGCETQCMSFVALCLLCFALFFCFVLLKEKNSYTRLCDEKSSQTRKNMAQVATFLVSAFWHGFYAGFYLSFASFAFLNIASHMMSRLFRPVVSTRDGSKTRPVKRVRERCFVLFERKRNSFC
jgi:hypothetical protein